MCPDRPLGEGAESVPYPQPRDALPDRPEPGVGPSPFSVPEVRARVLCVCVFFGGEQERDGRG